MPECKPTMWLNLSAGGDAYKKFIVVHQFGHALGLEHGHQCGNFWQLVNSYVDTEKMKKDRDLQGNPEFFEGMQYLSVVNSEMSKYDSTSIMQYW